MGQGHRSKVKVTRSKNVHWDVPLTSDKKNVYALSTPRVVGLTVASMTAVEAGTPLKGRFHLCQSLPGFLCITIMRSRRKNVFLTW